MQDDDGSELEAPKPPLTWDQEPAPDPRLDATDYVDLSDDPGRDLLKALVRELLRRLKSPTIAAKMAPSELELVRKLCADNSVSLAAIKKGEFGKVAQAAAEAFPFPQGARVVAPGSEVQQ